MFNKIIVVNALRIASALPLLLSFYTQAASPQHVIKPATPSYTIQVGDINVTALSDGAIVQDLHKLLRGTSSEMIDSLLAKGQQTNPVNVPITAYLIALPGHNVLVDTGAGQLFGPGNGRVLLHSLAKLGIAPQDITDILLTHLHADHAGGLMNDGRRMFPNASVFIGKPDADFFFNESKQQQKKYGPRYFATAKKSLGPYIDAGQVKTFTDTQTLLTGITGTVHPGHTPGSSFYTLESKGEKIVFVGDLVHVAAVQFSKPSVTIIYDQDQEQAAQVRHVAFSSFAKNGTLIAAPHLPFPGFGHVVRGANQGYVWSPIPFNGHETIKRP